MGFKLVRVDAIEPCKVFLPLGSHFIGRGKFLDCNDHRVSRKHAELIVTSDSILLKSLHQNPCFYKKKTSTETVIFSQPDSQVLTNGDQFGLIPDTFWYEVIYCLEDSPGDLETVKIDGKISEDQNMCIEKDQENQEVTINEDSNTNSYEHERGNCSRSSILEEMSESPSMLSPGNLRSPAKETEIETELLPTDPEDMGTTSIAQLNKSVDQPVESTVPANQAVESTNQPNEPADESVESTDQPNEPVESFDQPDQAATACKRANSKESCPCDVKRVKTETEEISKESESCTTEAQPVKIEPSSPQDIKPGPSNDQVRSSNNTNNGPTTPLSPTKPANKPLRERCMYGANCYRRNPQHKASFSHPADSDWGSGERAPCPWGAGCRRADPRHWRDHTHPPGLDQPPPPGNRPGKRTRRQRSTSPDSDSEDDTSLIVTGKRVRKPIVRQGWSDSEDEDPYKTDETDEWEPPSDITSQEFSQSQDQ